MNFAQVALATLSGNQGNEWIEGKLHCDACTLVLGVFQKDPKLNLSLSWT